MYVYEIDPPSKNAMPFELPPLPQRFLHIYNASKDFTYTIDPELRTYHKHQSCCLTGNNHTFLLWSLNLRLGFLSLACMVWFYKATYSGLCTSSSDGDNGFRPCE